MKRHYGATAAQLTLCMLCASPLRAAPASSDPLIQAHQLLRDRAQPNAEAMGARIEVRIASSAQERIAKAPCAPQVFLPPSTRMWGKVQIGFRCDGKSWQIRVPAQVAMIAPAPVLTRPLAAGTLLQDGDWAMTEIDIAAWPRGVTTDEQQLIGAKAGRPLRAGEPIPPDAIRSQSRLGTGDPVQVTLVGSGFTIKASGKIMQQASPGQSVRVQLDSGGTVAGTMREDHEIEVKL